MSLIDFFGAIVFDPASTSMTTNFLRVLSHSSKPYSVDVNATSRWQISLNFPTGGVTTVGFFPATSFVPGPTSQKSPPFGVVDTIVLYSGAGTVVAVFDNLAGLNFHVEDFAADPFRLVSGADDFLGDGAAQVFHAGAGQDLLVGGGGNDQLFGGADSDLMVGGDGNDQLSGQEGSDLLDGSGGDDILDGGAGEDVLFVTGGADTLNGGDGVDEAVFELSAAGVVVSLAVAGAQTLPGGSVTLTGVENLYGSAFNDTLSGADGSNVLGGLGGDDVLSGGDDIDTLIGGAGRDEAFGEAGDDVFIVLADYFVTGEIINGGAGVDTLRTMGSNIDYRVGTIASIDRIEFQQSASEATLNAMINASQIGAGLSSAIVVAGSDAQDSVQIFVASNASVDTSAWTFDFPAWQFEDYLVYVGDAGAESMIGFPGLDIFFGSPGDDTYNGNGAFDFAAYIFSPNAVTADLAVSGPQVIGGNQGTDTFINLEGLAGSQLSDLLYGDGGANIILGLYGDDLMVGRGGDDDLRGAEGADRIEGGMGADVLWGFTDLAGGPDGADTFVFRTAAEGGDTIRDFVAGQDFIEVSASGFGGGLVAGQAAQFTSGAAPTASGASGQFLYNTSNGQLSWDVDGSGAGAAVVLATLLGAPALTSANIVVTGIAASAALDETQQPSAFAFEGEDSVEQDAFDFYGIGVGVAAAPSHAPQAFGGGGAFGIQLSAWLMADPLDTFAFADGVGGFMSGEIGASLADMLDLQRGALGPDTLSPV